MVAEFAVRGVCGAEFDNPRIVALAAFFVVKVATRLRSAKRALKAAGEEASASGFYGNFTGF